MAAAEIVDFSPHHPDPSPPVPTASNLILIDNYDSFVWNVYQYLVLEGATVTVYRNDQITVDELIAKNPTQLVGLPVTRYHSLAGTHMTLPECLEVTSWIPKADGSKGVIMGVRHKELAIEGVQFHPESILSEDGRVMIKNFLRLQAGTWAENERLQKVAEANKLSSEMAKPPIQAPKKNNILQEIYARRREAVTAQKQIPSQRPQDLEAAYSLNAAPPQISFVDRLRQSPFSVSLMAEIKRGSPSKGIFALDIDAPTQAKKYALAGASVISVLTEPDWFKGSIEDLRAVRQVLNGMPNRPAILRKEFIFEEYQILEARLAGADTVLLIVKMLDEELLNRLYKYSISLGMEPLVEVQNGEEMATAVKLGSKYNKPATQPSTPGNNNLRAQWD
ncbi:hypothetical protein ONZ43_g5264 [Nemania bipapillata]|uniref:Uncharacterized protein n=1 Tax=Nemania bipapillata TaxID=110536 RepID=A0ACC2ICP7_9PEZI|nr:hypothetical protein ONZ43_g5264 [Nemania bipapillata]